MKKPSNAFQHYLKLWKKLSGEEKNPFFEFEKRDKLIYAAEKRVLEKTPTEKSNFKNLKNLKCIYKSLQVVFVVSD